MAAASASLPFKVVLLGEGRVGKTSVCLQYVKKEFSAKQESTIQATFLEKRVNVGKQSVKLMVWDTAGQERFHALAPIYYRDANGALLVYDITDRDSFTKVRNWVNELRKIVGDDIVLCIAGNKSDLVNKRQVNNDEALEYAKKVGAHHILTSAKTGDGVEEAFLYLTREMLNKENSQKNRNSSMNSRNFVTIADDTAAQGRSSSCC